MTKRPILMGAIAVASLLTSQSVSADPYANRQAQSNLGGGLIELLMTGRDPSSRPAPRQQYAPVSQAPAHQAPAYQAPAHVPAYSSPGSAPIYHNSLPVEIYARQQPAPQMPAPHQPLQQAALNPDFRQVERGFDPKFLPQVVSYSDKHRAGTIIVDTSDKFLYLVEGDGKARRYGIGVGRPGFEWRGVKSITRKAEWPDWRPPEEMKKRRPDLPDFMPGGPENPMGARGIYLGSSLYRIHGTNEPHSIGTAVSSGCFRMRNEDVTDLYERVRIGAKVIVM
jgi:lipoprotein-anchoring transpeptidase ErfK/SrfK